MQSARLLKNLFATWKNIPYKVDLTQKSGSKIYIAPLNPDAPEDFEEFQLIISDPDVALTSSWMDSVFGLENLKKIVDQAKATSQDEKKALREYLTLRIDDVRNVYHNLTKTNEEHKLGYCGVYDSKDGTLLGGCGLVPTKTNNKNKVDECDVSLHMRSGNQRSGLGTDLMRALLQYGFIERDLSAIVGSSLKNHPGTPKVCGKFGFIMDNIGKYTHYLMTDNMYLVSQRALRNTQENHTVASDILSNKSALNVDNLKESTSSSAITTEERKTEKEKCVNTKTVENTMARG